MLIASAHNLSLSYLTREIFSGVDFDVEHNAHIGLVGANGCGKTSLFRILSGRLQPDNGLVTFNRDTKLAYMEQFLEADEDESLISATRRIFAPLVQLEQKLVQLNHRLESQPSPELLHEQQRLQEQYEELGGYTYEARLRSTLMGLGFSEQDLLLPISALSGGQRSKAALAKVLLSDANLLLLDEPTNHLDIASLEWLENFLINYRGAYIVISHDRYFLDKVTNQTWAMHHQRLERYKANYSNYLQLRESAEEALERRWRNQRQEIRRIEAIIAQQKRFNQARNYVTIASKEKQIARLKKELVAPESKERTLHFNFNVPPPGGNDVLELHGVSKSYGGKTLFTNTDMLIRKGERVFLLGPNGCGKTTLLKIIMGEEYVDRGMVRPGVNIHIGYYDQLHRHLLGGGTILSHFTDAYPLMTQTQIRTMLGSFLFSGEAVENTLSALSGGEKARLTLMELLLSPVNLLLLDEPTNHLDIASREAVESALQDYPGTMLVVSHDRYLINKLADRIYYMTPQGLQEYLGGYDQLLEAQMQEEAAAVKPAAVSGGGEDYRRRKEEQAAQRKAEKRLEKAEALVAQWEEALSQLDTQLNDPEIAADYQRLMELSQQREQVSQELDRAMEEWEQASLALG